MATVTSGDRPSIAAERLSAASVGELSEAVALYLLLRLECLDVVSLPAPLGRTIDQFAAWLDHLRTSPEPHKSLSEWLSEPRRPL